MAERYDAIIIGGGHNGLTCGAYLARAGLKTLVLERRAVIGGAAVTEEVVPGFKFSVFSYLMSLLHPKVIADLELAKYGYQVLPATDMFGLLPRNDYIIFADDIAKTQASFARFSAKDAAIYPEFDRYLMDSVKIMRKILLETPPDPSCRDWRSFKETAKFLWKYRRVGGKLFRLIDLMTMSADDYLSEWFESSEVKAVLAYYCGIGTFVGPKSPGSAYVVMHHLMGEHAGAGGWGFVRGGMGSITQAIARSGQEKGLVVKTAMRGRLDRHGERPRDRRDARRRRALRGRHRGEQCLGEADLPQIPRQVHAARRFRARRGSLPDVLQRLQDQHRLRGAPAIHRLRCAGLRLRLSDLRPHRADHRISREGLRRRQIRRHVARTLHNAGDAELRRRHHCAARQACRPSVRRPRAAHAEGGRLDQPGRTSSCAT